MKQDLSAGKVEKLLIINYINVSFSTIHKFEEIYAVLFTGSVLLENH